MDSSDYQNGKQQRPLRRVLADGVIEEWSAAMGWVLTIPAEPRPRKIDLSDGAPGWEPLQAFLRRRRS
jgi:hypothetical protein